jgi:hypothetical protein
VLQKWVDKWPGQAAYVAFQIWFTNKMVYFFRGAKEKSKAVAD